MGRPRKNAGSINAKQRIGEAFWELLEENELREITVGMITAKAQCNRGTFYYHYQDIEDLLDSLLTKLLVDTSVLPEGLMRMATDDTYNIFDNLDPIFVHRMTLAIDRVGLSAAYGKMRAVTHEIWGYVLAAGEKGLTPEAEAFIDYYIGGVICMLAARPQALVNSTMFGGSEPVSPSFVEFSRKNYRFLLGEICASQGVDFQTVLDRIRDTNALPKSRTQ